MIDEVWKFIERNPDKRSLEEDAVLEALVNLETARTMTSTAKELKTQAENVLIPWMQNIGARKFSTIDGNDTVQFIPAVETKSVSVTDFKKNLADAGVDIGTIVSCESRAKKKSSRRAYVKLVSYKESTDAN